MRFGAVFRYRKSYGAVPCCDISYSAFRCGFERSKILRCDSVRFSEIRNLWITLWFSKTSNPAMWFGVVFGYRKSYGAVRRGSPLNCFSYGAVQLAARKTVQHSFFSAVHHMNKPRFRTVLPIFLGALTNRCFSTVHRTIKPYNTAVSYRSGTFSRGTNETAVSLRAPYE